MIVEQYPSSKRPQPVVVQPNNNLLVVYPNQKDKALADSLGITTEELFRRNNIIKDKWKETPVTEHSMIRPKHYESFKYWGEMKVTHLCSSIHDYKEKWPEDDNPYIITAWSANKDTYMVCTTNFVELSYDPHVSC